MIHYISWEPDTCSCKIVYEYDDALPEPHHTATSVKACHTHSNMANQDVFRAVLKETRFKSQALLIASQVVRQIVAEPDLMTGTYDQNRILHLFFRMTLPKQKRDQLRDALDITFGKGKAVVD